MKMEMGTVRVKRQNIGSVNLLVPHSCTSGPGAFYHVCDSASPSTASITI